MSRRGDRSPPEIQAPEQAAALRGLLAEAAFSEAGIAAVFGFRNWAAVRRADTALLRRRLRADTHLALLVRLFLLGERVDAAAVQNRLGPDEIRLLVACGLCEVMDDGLEATVRLAPRDGWVLASDGPGLSPDLEPYHVMGEGRTSRLLAASTIRRRGELVLDVGCGNGLQAFLAARHAARVIATDVNPRALAFARFNARLNGVANVELLEGDLFEPAAGIAFDLIVCNAPLVISPRRRHLFRDAGLPADDLTCRLAHEGAAHLAEGGICHIMGSWLELGAESWTDRLGAWLEPTGCDVVVLRERRERPDAYALRWLREGGESGGELGHSLQSWVEYYEAMGARWVSTGLITLRKRRSAEHHRVFEDIAPGSRLPLARSIARRFEARDLLAQRASDDQLLSHRYRLAGDVLLEEWWSTMDGSLDYRGARAASLTGLASTVELRPQELELLKLCDGSRTLRAAASRAFDTEEGLVRWASPATWATVRRCLELGLLIGGGDG